MSDASITDVITIDGPAGAGKSSVAREVARRLDFAYLDTGAMYRAATWWAVHGGVDLSSHSALIESTRGMRLEMAWIADRFEVRIDGQDITDLIRSPEITEKIHLLSGIPEVRTHLVALQREFAAKRRIVTEGRDQGTVVFPKAACKIYLDASLEERARRRAEQYATQQVTTNIDELRGAIARRDENDAGRETAPMKPADDAIVVDTTELDFDGVVERVVALARPRLSAASPTPDRG